jgi:hypothetical protein
MNIFLNKIRLGPFTSFFEILEKYLLNHARMVGFSSDNCNVMFCVNHSLSTPIRQTVLQIITIKFGCHMLHLCSWCARCALTASLIICQNSWKRRFINWMYYYYYYCYASKVLPDHLEDLLGIITNHFSYSPKAKNALFSFPRRDKTGYFESWSDSLVNVGS